MLGMELTPEQRAAACEIIRRVVMMQYASLGNTDIRGNNDSFTELYVGDNIIMLPFPGGGISLKIADEEIINAIKSIREQILADHNRVGEFLDSLDSIEPEEESC